MRKDETFITINQNIVIMSHSIVYQCNVVVYNDSWIRNNAINFLVCMQKLMKYQTVDIVVCMPKMIKYSATTILLMETYQIDSVLHGRPECRFHLHYPELHRSLVDRDNLIHFDSAHVG
jgi:hypothetical protein